MWLFFKIRRQLGFLLPIFAFIFLSLACTKNTGGGDAEPIAGNIPDEIAPGDSLPNPSSSGDSSSSSTIAGFNCTGTSSNSKYSISLQITRSLEGGIEAHISISSVSNKTTSVELMTISGIALLKENNEFEFTKAEVFQFRIAVPPAVQIGTQYSGQLNFISEKKKEIESTQYCKFGHTDPLYGLE